MPNYFNCIVPQIVSPQIEDTQLPRTQSVLALKEKPPKTSKESELKKRLSSSVPDLSRIARRSNNNSTRNVSRDDLSK